MRMITVIEDTCGRADCISQHGLCIYIETAKHKLLFDTGADDGFLHNSRKLGIDVRQVDTVVLSHGHYDHGGGIMSFAKINAKAEIYMQSSAGDDYYHGERYIGIDKDILKLPQTVLVDGDRQIDEELSLFSGITGRRYWPQSNRSLTIRTGKTESQDEFLHEQCLVVSQDGRKILFSGCAHNGILNLLDRYREIYHDDPQVVVSGFHMMKKGDYTKEEEEVIINTARELKETGILFYTGHCTGEKAIRFMEPILGEQLKRLKSGQEIK